MKLIETLRERCGVCLVPKSYSAFTSDHDTIEICSCELTKLLDVIEKQGGTLKEYANLEECADCACWIPACTTMAETKEMLDDQK